jgi:protein SCO1/2
MDRLTAVPRFPRRAFFSLLFAGLLALPSLAAPPLPPPPAAPPAAARPPAIKDVPVQTQEGRSVRFYSDLVKGRVVAINFIFTSCTTICPLMGARFARLQQLVPPGVSLISVSIDPTTDTPARLLSWSRKLGARPGWTLVTGSKADLDALTQSLGSASANPADHAAVILIVDDRPGTAARAWQRLDGLADPAKVAKVLAGVVGR